ncbi:hypothetical protein L9F63_025849 [Diploptera punctata]|uniref:Uncharacterized protein n=1 Tax=Diploptera punctata TaxID=6984 RepID=A0AAD8E3H3_DIPPU|nr:hypothetical protein L9F63_008311 [Diploptera punctata]KAJ9575202.1 hypothetical protein L9F63_025849 [Diploptera punctata]
MAAKLPNGSPSKLQIKYDVVKFDGKLKEVIHLEKLTRKQWEKKWGFTADLMKMYKEDVVKSGLKLEKKSSQPWITSRTEIKILPSPPVPTTSSAMVGWRSSQLQYCLERVGPLYVSPRFTIEPPGHRPRKQFNICIC